MISSLCKNFKKILSNLKILLMMIRINGRIFLSRVCFKDNNAMCIEEGNDVMMNEWMMMGFANK